MNNRFNLDLTKFLSQLEYLEHDLSRLKAKLLAESIATKMSVSHEIEKAEYGVNEGEFYLAMKGIDDDDAKKIMEFFQSLDENASLTEITDETVSPPTTTYSFNIPESTAYHELLPFFMESFSIAALENPEYLQDLYQEAKLKMGNDIGNLLQEIDEHTNSLAETQNLDAQIKGQILLLKEMLRKVTLAIELDRDNDVLDYGNVVQYDFVVDTFEDVIDNSEVLSQNEHGEGLIDALDQYVETLMLDDESDLADEEFSLSDVDDEEEYCPHIPPRSLATMGIFAITFNSVNINKTPNLSSSSTNEVGSKTPPNTPSETSPRFRG